MMGKFNQSLEIFLKAESCLQSPDHEVYHYIGDLLCLNAKHSKGNILDAKEYFKRSILCGKQVDTYKTLARIYRKEKDFLKAIELLESCLRFERVEFINHFDFDFFSFQVFHLETLSFRQN